LGEGGIREVEVIAQAIADIAWRSKISLQTPGSIEGVALSCLSQDYLSAQKVMNYVKPYLFINDERNIALCKP